jgi:ABC-type phosphate transport system permease subunit
VFLFLQQKPIIVRIPQDPPKSELSGLADVLLGSLGLTGVIVLAAVLLGAVMAGVMFWVRSRDSR